MKTIQFLDEIKKKNQQSRKEIQEVVWRYQQEEEEVRLACLQEFKRFLDTLSLHHLKEVFFWLEAKNEV